MNDFQLHDWRIEANILAAMILHPRICDDCLERLTQDDFYRPCHQVLFGSLKEVRRRGMEPQPAILLDHLRATGSLEEAGGLNYITISLMEPKGSVNGYHTWVEFVREKAQLRTILANIEKARDGIQSGLSASEIAGSLVRECEGVGGAMQGIVAAGDVNASKPDTGYPTGVPLIDDELSTHGAPVGQMCVVLAREGIGKSSLMVQVATNAAWSKRGVLYISLADLNKERLKPKILRAQCGFSNPSTAEAHGRREEFDRAEYELRKQVSFHIDDRTKTGSPDVDDILGSIDAWRRRCANTGTPLQEVFVDYSQKLKSRHFGPRDEYAASKYASNRISRYAEASGLVVWVGSQITEGSEKHGTDDKTKGGNHWQEDSGLTVKIKGGEGNARKFVLSKSRFGGQFQSAEMVFDEDTLTFRVPGWRP